MITRADRVIAAITVVYLVVLCCVLVMRNRRNRLTSISFNTNTPVTLTAPATYKGKPFKSWEGCDSSNGRECAITNTKERTVTANYEGDKK